jgi:hypothetical protein
MPDRYRAVFRKAGGILKRAVTPRDEWHIDWLVMGQKTFRLNGKAHALVVLDIGSNIRASINTRTREDIWQHLDELATFWGHTPKAAYATMAPNLKITTVSKRVAASTMFSLALSNRTGTPCKGILRTSSSRLKCTADASSSTPTRPRVW